jgi:uncharacterized protein YecE (DUF72 family)
MPTTRNAAVRVGCSGWQYKHWRGDFYPAELGLSRWFEFYSTRFDTVEINNSFYRLPEAETFARWQEQAPRQFVYAVKASRFLTHMKKLREPEDPLDRFFSNARELGSHLGPVLFQLPPRWPMNLDRLERFLDALEAQTRHLRRSGFATRIRHAIEFREPSWYHERVFALLHAHRIALCLHDMRGSSSPKLVTGRFVYVRFHGVHESQRTVMRTYGGRYADQVLDEWADWLAERISSGIDVYAYFNNDVGGHAPRDALRLRERVLTRASA